MLTAIKNFFKKVFGSTFELDQYLLEGDIPKVAKKVADDLVPQQKKFNLLFDALPCIDRDALRRNARAVADEVSRLTGRDVKFKDGELLGNLISLYFTIAAPQPELSQEKEVIPMSKCPYNRGPVEGVPDHIICDDPSSEEGKTAQPEIWYDSCPNRQTASTEKVTESA